MSHCPGSLLYLWPTDALKSGWGGVILSPISKKVSDYWVGEECNWDITTKEAMAINRMLLSNCEFLRDTRVDVHIDNQAVIQAWNNEWGQSHVLIQALNKIFFTTLDMNVALHLIYVLRYVNAWVSVCVFSKNRQKIIKK